MPRPPLQTNSAELLANFWAAEVQQVAAALRTDPAAGLSGAEARRRLVQYGENRLQEGRPRSKLLQFLGQFADWMIGLLLVAAAISGATGEWNDSALILAIVVINAIIGYVQEQRAERAVAALKNLAQPTARVWRDSSLQTVPSLALVPGDVIELTAGAITPADARVVGGSELQADEAALTGESMPVDKQVEPAPADAALPEHVSMVHAGTAIVRGHGRAIVTATGMTTELGRIAAMLDTATATQTPLQSRLAALSRRLAVVVVIVCGVVFVAGWSRGDTSPGEMFLVAVSLAVAAIPEGLPAVITIALAMGSQRMSRRQAIVRQLSAVETLGSVDVICSDKTGTLTQNKMAVSEIVAAEDGDSQRRDLLEAALLCNDAQVVASGDILGSATESALLYAARGAGINIAEVRADYPRIGEFPFSSQRKLMTTLHASSAGTVVYTKGAPEAVLRRTASVWNGEQSEPLMDQRRRQVEQLELELAARGRRVLALARRQWTAPEPPDSTEQVESQLTLLGFVGITDPPRPEASQAIAECHTAGIRVVMITGDHQKTAASIASELGILDGDSQILTGKQLDQLDDQRLAELAPRTAVYARVSPHHKLRIIRAHQSRGSVVAMTGDGVNDAPALKQADIGVAMGITGTDVSKQAARMVLADDNFATIVAAVEEGRVVYDNIRKFVLYLLTTNFSEILFILGAILLGLPLPLLPVHLLWINLVTDGPSALALAFETSEPGTMTRKPRRREEGILAEGVGRDILIYGLLIAGLCVGVYWRALARPSELPAGEQVTYARTVAFAAVAASQLVYVLGLRSRIESFLRQGLWSNWRLTVAVAVGLFLQAAVVYLPFLQKVFHTTPILPGDLPLVAVPALTALAAVELRKMASRRTGAL
jgi:Ca2+-transporting ATPase